MNPEIKRLQKLVSRHQEKIWKLQEQCPHSKETLVYENKSDTGNWCAQDDSYWAEYKCYECDKSWRGEQGAFNGIKKGSPEYYTLIHGLDREL